MHHSYCTCPRCARAKTTRKIALGIGIPVLAIAAFIFFYPSLATAPAAITEAKDTISDSVKQVQKKIEDANKVDYPKIAELIHDQINTERAAVGKKPLSYDDKLSLVATGHSQDMAANNFFEHVNLNGQDPSDRARASGYSCYKTYPDGSYSIGIGENLFTGGRYYTEETIASQTVDGWMHSPGHRENILNADYDKEGIGIAESTSESHMWFITEDFC